MFCDTFFFFPSFGILLESNRIKVLEPTSTESVFFCSDKEPGRSISLFYLPTLRYKKEKTTYRCNWEGGLVLAPHSFSSCP